MASTGGGGGIMETSDVGDCVLFDSFGKFIQLLCGVLAFSVLIVKRYREKPRRPFKIWGMDVLKQAVSGLCAHFVGIITAEIVSGATANISPCSWYFVAFTVDVTLGVTLSLVIFHYSRVIAAKYQYAPLATTGNYGQVIDEMGVLVREPNYRIWAIQMSFWSFVCVVPARFVCMLVTYTLRNSLSGIAKGIHSGFIGDPKGELMFVMVAGPLVMNAIQFLLQDQVLKYSKRRQAGRESENNTLVENEMTDSSAFSLPAQFDEEDGGNDVDGTEGDDQQAADEQQQQQDGGHDGDEQQQPEQQGDDGDAVIDSPQP